MDRPHDAANAASRRRLADTLARLQGQHLAQDLGDGWTVAATLAHLAFWDRSCEARWRRYGRQGALDDFPDALIDVVNAANLATWRALDPPAAAGLALAAAEEVDALIAGLPQDAVDRAQADGRGFMVDRSGHRHAHLDEIGRVLDPGHPPYRNPWD